MPLAEAPAGRGWWHCTALREGAPVWFAVVPVDDLHPDGTRVVADEARATAQVAGRAACIAHLQASQVVRLELPASGPVAESLWFVEMPEPAARPPATCLLAFTGHELGRGELVVSPPADLTPDDQVAAIRWYVGTGEVDQVYVAPHHRRRGVASALALAAGTLSVARSGPRLWGDGQRTADGERWRNAGPWAHRAADLTHLAPPMTPVDER